MAMINQAQLHWIRNWSERDKRHFRIPSAHALKALEEMVELCLAMGATPEQIRSTVGAEIRKEIAKDKDFGNVSPAAIAEEMADVQICLGVIETGFELDTETAIHHKIPVLEERQWSPDKYGVLRRPR